MSLKNHTTVKWTKFGEAECDKGWFIGKEQLEDTGDDNFPLENYFMFYCNFLIFFCSVCCFAKENSIYRWLLLKYKI